MSEPTKARKGDLILVERVSHNCYSPAAYAEAKTAGRTLPDTETEYRFGVVASATRDGKVKTWKPIGWGDELLSASDRPIRHDRCWTMSAKRVDITSVLAAAKAHHWPGDPGHPMGFATIEQARNLARSFATEGGAA